MFIVWFFQYRRRFVVQMWTTLTALYRIFLPGSHCWPGRGRGTASAGSGPDPPIRPRPPDLSLPSRRGQKVHTHVKNLPSESKHSELDNNHSQKGNVTKCIFFLTTKGLERWVVECDEHRRWDRRLWIRHEVAVPPARRMPPHRIRGRRSESPDGDEKLSANSVCVFRAKHS